MNTVLLQHEQTEVMKAIFFRNITSVLFMLLMPDTKDLTP